MEKASPSITCTFELAPINPPPPRVLAVVPETPQAEEPGDCAPLDQWADTSEFIGARWRNAFLTHRQLQESKSQPY